jgi:hypothetical protein
MREIQLIRRFELAFIVLAAIVHVGWRLFWDTMNFDSMNYGLMEGIAGYNQILNNYLPHNYLSRFATHSLVCVSLFTISKGESGEDTQEVWGYALSTIIFIAVGVWLFYYFKLYIHKYIINNVLTQVKLHSQYRKMTVFIDTVGSDNHWPV